MTPEDVVLWADVVKALAVSFGFLMVVLGLMIFLVAGWFRNN